MPNGFLEALEIRPETGLFVPAFGFLALLGALAAIFSAQLSPTARVLAVAASLLAAGAELRPHLDRRGRRRVQRAMLGADDSWQIFSADGAVTRGRLVRSWGGALGPAVGLEWRCEDGQCRQAWLVGSRLPGQTWRRLRVRLRFA